MLGDDALAKIEEAYEEQGLVLKLRPPVPIGQVEAFERRAGFSLPRQLVALWEKSDGSGRQFWGALGPHEPLRFPSFVHCVELYDLEWPCCTIELPVPREGEINEMAARHGKLRWFPFADFNDGTTTVICDMQPGPKGKEGQILVYRMPDEVEVVAESFEDFLAAAVGTLRHYGVGKWSHWF